MLAAAVFGPLSVERKAKGGRASLQPEPPFSTEDSQDIIDCVNTGYEETLISFEKGKVELNNLGHWQDPDDDPYIMINNVGTAPDGTKLKMRIEAKGPYKVMNPDLNKNILRRDFISLNIPTPEDGDDGIWDENLDSMISSTQLEVCFLDQSNKKKNLDAFELSIYDVDHGGKVRECVMASEAMSYTEADNTLLMEVPMIDGDSTRICASNETVAIGNPKSPYSMTDEAMRVGVSFLYGPNNQNACVHFTLQNTCCGKLGRMMFLSGRSAVSPDRCPSKVVVHGDPMFKHPGKPPAHFSLPPRKMTTLLEWKAHDGSNMKLSGKTFERYMQGNRTITTDKRNQWFDQFIVTQNGERVLDVQSQLAEAAGFASGFGTMQVLLDERVVKDAPPMGAVKLYSSAKQAVKVTASKLPERLNIGDKHAEKLDIEAGGVKMTIYSSKAGKFAWKKNQKKFMHLNIAFNSGIPQGAEGVFAQLAGVEPVSAKTQSMLHIPSKEKRAARKAVAAKSVAAKPVAAKPVAAKPAAATKLLAVKQPAAAKQAAAKQAAAKLVAGKRPAAKPAAAKLPAAKHAKKPFHDHSR